MTEQVSKKNPAKKYVNPILAWALIILAIAASIAIGAMCFIAAGL